MNFIERYHVLKKAIVFAKEHGKEIICGKFASATGDCLCPLAALAFLDKAPLGRAPDVAERLLKVEPNKSPDWKSGWIVGFINGFDGALTTLAYQGPHPDAYMLGQALRAEFEPRSI